MPIELVPTAGGPDVLPNPIPAPDPQPPKPDPAPEPTPVPPLPEPAPAFSSFHSTAPTLGRNGGHRLLPQAGVSGGWKGVQIYAPDKRNFGPAGWDVWRPTVSKPANGRGSLATARFLPCAVIPGETAGSRNQTQHSSDPLERSFHSARLDKDVDCITTLF